MHEEEDYKYPIGCLGYWFNLLLYRFFESRQKFQMLDHVSVLYRRHAGNTTRDHQEAMRNLLRVLALL